MAFLHLSLLAGCGLAAAPILLHLLMRQRPRHQVFPALRFIKQRQVANSRRLQLRHWVLLALRCVAIIIPALALARPSVVSAAASAWFFAGLLGVAALAVGVLALAFHWRQAARAISWGLGGFALLLALGSSAAAFQAWRDGASATLGSQEVPVAAVLVIDTSPRIEYTQENRTRLAVAQEIAEWLIPQFPEDSEVAVLDSRGAGSFAVDRAAATRTVQRLRSTGTPRPLAELLRSALQLVGQSDRRRKEVYLFSDLTAVAWKADQAGDLESLLQDRSHLLTYVVDVGVDQPRNLSLGELQLSAQLLPQSGQLRLSSALRSQGLEGERTVELHLEDADPSLPVVRDGRLELPLARKRGAQVVKFLPGEATPLEFTATGFELGPTNGWLRILGEDGLAVDDVRYFTIDVQKPWPVLVVTGPNVEPDYLVNSISPPEYRQTNQARFTCVSIDQAELSARDLSAFRAICLLDPAPLPDEVWQKLASFAEAGGGVATFLGHHAQAESFNTPASARVLGGKLARVTRSGGDLYVAPRALEHPILAPFRELEGNVPWERFPVYYHWNLDDLAGGTRSVVNYGNNRPALLQTPLGAGKSLTLTTPISDPLRPQGRPAWNELPTGEDAWPAFVLVNEMLQYLVQTGEGRLNYRAGETVVLNNPPEIFPERYQLYTPLEEPQDVLAREGKLTIRVTEHPGAYRLRGQRGGPVARGFSVNLPDDVGDLTRLPQERLDELLGKDRYRLAKTREEIDRAVGSDRQGSEFFLPLFAFFALVLGLEQLLANRFYRKEE